MTSTYYKNYDQIVEDFFNNLNVIEMRHQASNKSVILFEMAHIAPKEFYSNRNALMEDLVENGYLIHHEGVRNRKKNKTADKLKMDGYQPLADAIYFDHQKLPTVKYEIVDVDISDFPLVEKMKIKAVMKMVHRFPAMIKKTNSEHIVQETLVKSITENSRPKNNFFINEDGFILKDRNEYAIKKALEALKDTDKLALIWGKHHIHGMVELLEEQGFYKKDSLKDS